MDQISKSYLSQEVAIQKYSFLTKNMLKNLLFKNIGGFRQKVVCKVGRRILLAEAALLSFIESCKEGGSK